MSEQQSYELGSHPDMPPPVTLVGYIGWMRANLFSSPINTVLTVFCLWLIYVSVPPVIFWAFIDADWVGTTRDDCSREGACWVFIGHWFKQIMYGRYPDSELWRINTAYILLVAGVAPLLINGFKYKGILAIFLLVVYPVIAFFLFVGDSFGLPGVETPLWGGLFLTLVISLTGIVASLPIGILLALGRRSDMPIVKALCVGFIEFWRGVPLITVLFMSSVMFPLFLPEGMNFDKLIRALVGVMLFSAAYMAEVVRGGLQAIPRGQYEAADALGFNTLQKMRFIILPQALRIVIPPIVGQFIGAYKSSSLVSIVGLFDLLGIQKAILANSQWQGLRVELYVFLAAIYFVGSFGMSSYSRRLETRLGVGER